MNKPLIYLDNNATTPIAEEVLEHMLSLFKRPLNPSSVHAYGRDALSHLKSAKITIADFLKVSPDELYFTSGGTESMNMLIKGLYPGHGTIVTTQIEHASVDSTILDLKKKGASVSYVPVDIRGFPEAEAIEQHLGPDVSLMVFSAVYSETGAKLHLDKIAKIAEKHQIPLVIDGVALLGKELFTLQKGISAMGFSSHKIHGPKGVGLSYIKKGVPCKPLLFGGAQQSHMRPGTENVEALCGFAKAVSLLHAALPHATHYMQHLKDIFISYITSHLDRVHVHALDHSICNTVSLGCDDIDGEALLFALDKEGVMASMGSACSSGTLEPSRVLLHMGLPRKQALATLRFSFSRMTKEEDVLTAATILCSLVTQQRSLCSIL